MENTYWLRQTAEEPLYPDIDWSRPETKRRGGKLAIIGGNNQSFQRLAAAYEISKANSVGQIRVVMPDALESILSQMLPDEGFYVPSNASGGIGTASENELLASAEWSDAVLFAGDFGRNSETPQVLNTFINLFEGQLTITADSFEVLLTGISDLIMRDDTHLVLSLAQLRELFINSKQTTAITTDMGIVKLVDVLHEFTEEFSPAITTFFENKLITGLSGQVATTPYEWSANDPSWRVPVAAKQAAFWMQHKETPFKALVSAHLSE